MISSSSATGRLRGMMSARHECDNDTLVPQAGQLAGRAMRQRDAQRAAPLTAL